MVLIASAIFAISLFVFRLNIRSLALIFGVGVSAATLWLYLDTKYLSQPKRTFSPAQPCVCAVCKHENTVMCLENKCMCCLVTKNEKVIGHSNNPLQ
jgi:hypothetical protein